MLEYFNGDFLGDCLILTTILEELEFGTKKYNINFGIKEKTEDQFIFTEEVFLFPELLGVILTGLIVLSMNIILLILKVKDIT